MGGRCCALSAPYWVWRAWKLMGDEGGFFVASGCRNGFLVGGLAARVDGEDLGLVRWFTASLTAFISPRQV